MKGVYITLGKAYVNSVDAMNAAKSYAASFGAIGKDFVIDYYPLDMTEDCVIMVITFSAGDTVSVGYIPFAEGQ